MIIAFHIDSFISLCLPACLLTLSPDDILFNIDDFARQSTVASLSNSIDGTNNAQKHMPAMLSSSETDIQTKDTQSYIVRSSDPVRWDGYCSITMLR
jgi:hypothetical protein